MPKLRKLTVDEQKAIRDKAAETIINDCQNDSGYLRSVVDDRVEGLTVSERLDAISNDPDVLPEALGFNPYKED